MLLTVTLTLLEGLGVTLELFALTLLLALPLGLIIALGAMSRLAPLRWAVGGVVWVIRGTPLMIQILIVFYGPGLLFDLPLLPRFGAAQLDALGLEYVAKTTQADALMEVASGASDACVIDLLMAGAMIGEGTSYPDLTYTVQLNSEEYGVAFRKGSDLTDAFNTFWKEAYDDGTVMEVATTYGVQESVIAK